MYRRSAKIRPPSEATVAGAWRAGRKLSRALNRATSQKDRPVAFQHGEPAQRSDSDCMNLSGPDTHRTQGANVTSQRGVVLRGSVHWMAGGWFTAGVIYPLGKS